MSLEDASRTGPVPACEARLSVAPASVSTRAGCVDFPGRDRRLLRQQVAELVGAGEDHLLGERVDVEVDRRAVRQEDALLGQVDGQLGVGVAGEQLEESRMRRRVDHDRQHAVLEAVAAEDVRVGGRQDRADSPGR